MELNLYNLSLIICQRIVFSFEVHRDLKPENCLLDDDSRLSNLRLIDFGSAVIVDPSSTSELHTDLAGTPYYMSYAILFFFDVQQNFFETQRL